MAAKVVMVAVPTVLGIASVRVYSVKEAPSDGLVSPDKLNIYTPLSEAASPKAAPESPGLIEQRLTTTRESVLPYVQAVKRACVSVKRGSVNLYHAAEDVYYYMIDPPPGFLPRLGTITMAGLLGMFLARKGSRFRRVAVPLGLMGAGVSVCYPAQAVSVLKVTGNKVYAAGQWSSAAASSLLAAKEPAGKERASSQPQPPSEPGEESGLTNSSSSAKISSEVESASLSDEPVVPSTVELPGTSPAETGSAATASAAQTEPPHPSEEAVENKKLSDGKPVSIDGTPAGVELETVQDESAAEESEGQIPPGSSTVDPVVESEAAEEPSLPVAEETLTSMPLRTPPPQQPEAGNTKEGSGFKTDPALMDFGQSSPEDEDLYSTRS
ncbi:PREDICTED: MICOS complex subunit MIC27-like isoform X1 [Cyprinodon variegatus]|uniref:MICOS complex subunit MIC27-like isoform X1 n=1 Tax=Cyprinodon variegatus TaxID=28743 RepID=UPI000742AB8F|nr:PREDICTED: MICOS complex subunit MIC27-like isoform X1 [Cyprinodon variegatus]